jgi:hypothetical protein
MPVELDEQQLSEVGAIAGSATDGPVVMLNLNLNRYRGRAAYAADPPAGGQRRRKRP